MRYLQLTTEDLKKPRPSKNSEPNLPYRVNDAEYRRYKSKEAPNRQALAKLKHSCYQSGCTATQILCEYRESWGSDDAWASKDPSESSPDLAPPVVVCRQDELVGGIDSLRNNASTDEGASMLKGHPEVNASVDWGRKPTIEPSKLQLGRNSWVFSNGESSEKRRIEY